MLNRVLLIGASGFVGTRLIEEIGEERCVNLDKQHSSRYDNITVIQDIRNEGIDAAISHQLSAVVLLAAEHRDDVSPVSLYYDVNVQGTRNVLDAMDKKGIKSIVFTSSVAVYGLNKDNPDEEYPADPFNHYGKSKWQAEEVLREWYQKDPENRSLSIIRPTVIFGEANRGNVYNLLRQIASGKFLMIGKGENKKSMAYVGNVVAFIKYLIDNDRPGYRVFNYVDKPDFNMNKLVSQVRSDLEQNGGLIRIPEVLGMLGGFGFDIVAKATGKKLPISSVRVKKFCATTQFSADKLDASGFQRPYTLEEGLERTLRYEFIENHDDKPVFFTE
ncbi:NAD-dependent epimerase/dehydratase family protein [Prosthecochloris vibrioformis]|uniref:NAD-dependent epimerase/dehydratase family protein n=1 Tax=Prosthecochloris vibrioformis TaxID=1098 RepID=A0A5C4RQG0_PROVB|nr:NAD-dependent epimerase/dehydratase family protein [Prosthecochloris vibrioformis]TNJ33420.1 NAD-dependent epimerase/dehydratase family protein [Prosthecochloris vibrioformis]